MIRHNPGMPTEIIALLIGLAAGVSGGIFGIGGGLIIVPALVAFLSFPQHKAQGTSLAVLMVPVGILGVYNYWKEQSIDFKVALYIALAFVFGAFFGSKLALGLDPTIMRKVFAVFLIVVGGYLFFRN